MPDLSEAALQQSSIEDSSNHDNGYKPEFTTTQLGGILDCTRVQEDFLCDRIFTKKIEFDTESIFWDKVYDDVDEMAPAVCPCVQAPLMGATNEFSRTHFTPAYIKVKHILSACTPLPMMPGETPWGDLSPEERFDLAMAKLLSKQDRMTRKTQTFWMSQALTNAGYSVEGDLYPKADVDLKRDPCLAWRLSSAQKWGKDGGHCGMETLQDAYDKVACTADGGPEINTLIMNSWTCRKMKQDQEILECLKTERGNALLDIQGFDITPRARKPGGARLSFTIGGVSVWCVDQYYMAQQPDGTKVKTPYFPDGSVVGLALGEDDCNAHPTKLFGAIKDCEMMRAAETHTTMWKINDPSAKVVMTQTAPLPVVLNPNATFHMKVC